MKPPATAMLVERLSVLTPDALAMLGALVAHSGWNQTPQDWAIFARQGSVFVSRDASGAIIGSGAVLPMGAQVAWISMILVTPAARGKGVGSALFAHCLKAVQAAGRTAYLDATPAGEVIYRQFGFVPEWRLTRWRRGPAVAVAATVASASTFSDVGAPHDAGTEAVAALSALDTRALGAPRGALLMSFLQRADAVCLRDADDFLIVRSGRVAHQIGPLLARNEARAATLLQRALQGLPGALLIDVPDERAALAGALRTAGFTPQRSFLRMRLGDQALRGESGWIHAIAGPEFA